MTYICKTVKFDIAKVMCDAIKHSKDNHIQSS